MAEVVISFILQMALEKLTTPLIEEAGSMWGLNKELKRLSDTFSTVQSVLHDAEQRQSTEETLRKWLNDLKYITYDADDVLDEVSYRALESQIERRGKDKVWNFFWSYLCSNPVVFQRKIGRRIRDIRRRLDEIAKDRAAFHLRECGENIYGRSERLPPLDTSSLIDENDIFGRVEDRMKIIETLVSDDVYSVIPIVGMGGLGKTTLAQLIYNDERIKHHFEMRMWVFVGEDFDLRRLTRAIVESASKKAPEVTELDPLQINLKELLEGRRFLIVLDDVWNLSCSEWDILSAPFKVGAKGSKIMVTARSEHVSMIVGTVPSYRLKSLSDGDSWSLFKRCTAIERRLVGNARLEAVGREIVKKCGGLPLAIKVIGRLLYLKADEMEWDLVLKSEIWNLPTNADILPVLRLSYHHLPGSLKQCFAYCSIFPKDYRFEKDRLVELWMAVGFVKPNGRKQMEDMGGKYFDELLLRSFFQYSHNDWEDRPIYKMHDLIHDLARCISGEECCIMDDTHHCNISVRARHSSLLCEINGLSSFQSFYKASRLRTFLSLVGTNSLPYITKSPIVVPLDMFQMLKFLRVLDLSYTSITELPSSIRNLKHLRLLDISQTSIKHLPDSITFLYNMQTLRLKNCSKLIELPKNMNNLINLRHIYMHTRSVNFGPRLISMPPRIGKMIALRTLSLFVVGRESGCKIEELRNLRNLRGYICISKLENVMNEEEAKEADLVSKEFLHELELQWSPHNLRDEGVEEVLRGLQPHVNIKLLEIFNYSGNEFPSWMKDQSFSKLETVCLLNCRNCKILPPLGQLPSLKDLYIRGMHKLKQIGHEFCGANVVNRFPSLERLELEDMPAFEEWCEVEGGYFNCLKELELLDCPKLSGLPFLPATLTDLLISDCKDLCSLPRLTSLQNLYLNGCNKSILCDLSYLTSLSSLSISGFPMLAYFPDKVGLNNLTMLKRLVISSCPQLISLLDVELPDALRSFKITQLDSLNCLPKKLFYLTSLQNLDIQHCNQLSSLPEDGLPPTLQNLKIYNCPLLKEWFLKVDGEDRSKIAIDDQQITLRR